MPQSPSTLNPAAAVELSPSASSRQGPEGFWGVVLRRSRYAAAIGFSALLFCTLGWWLASPPPQWAGVSLVAWENHSVLSGIALAILLVGITAVCSLIVHPDSPHMGLFCALAGMAGLSIRGGTIRMLIQQDHYPAKAQSLAIECIQWAIIILVAEIAARWLHDRYFKNTHWITRGVPDLAIPPQQGVSGGTRQAKKGLPWGAGIPLAVVVSAGVAMVALAMFMQSQDKGQVVMACLLAFFFSTFAAFMAVPNVPALPLLLTVPLTAAGAYLWSMHIRSPFPGHAGFFAARALPIDYASAGVAGAILGYYAALRWVLHSEHEQSKR